VLFLSAWLSGREKCTRFPCLCIVQPFDCDRWGLRLVQTFVCARWGLRLASKLKFWTVS
jgi:hypothetical protein